MSLSSLLSSIFPSASCDAPEEKEVAEKVAEEPEAEEEEEEEPEDVCSITASLSSGSNIL